MRVPRLAATPFGNRACQRLYHLCNSARGLCSGQAAIEHARREGDAGYSHRNSQSVGSRYCASHHVSRPIVRIAEANDENRSGPYRIRRTIDQQDFTPFRLKNTIRARDEEPSGKRGVKMGKAATGPIAARFTRKHAGAREVHRRGNAVPGRDLDANAQMVANGSMLRHR